MGADVSGRADPPCGRRLVYRVNAIETLRFVYGADGTTAFFEVTSNAIETLCFVYGADGTTAFFEVMDDGQDKRFVFSADGREPAETMDFLRVEPVDA